MKRYDLGPNAEPLSRRDLVHVALCVLLAVAFWTVVAFVVGS
jgi:hypothetical protein